MIKKSIKLNLTICLVIINTFIQSAIAAPCKGGDSIIVSQDGKTSRIYDCKNNIRLESIENQISKLNESQKNDAERFITTMNQLAKKIDKANASLDKSNRMLAFTQSKLLEVTSSAKSDNGDALAKLSDDSVNTLRKLSNLKETSGEKTVDTKLSPELIDAVSNLNFNRANEIIDSLNRIEKGVNRTEAKVDIIKSDIEESKLEQTFAHATSIKARGDIGQIAALTALVKKGRTYDSYDFSGMGLSELKVVNFNAPEADLTLTRLIDAQLIRANLEKSKLIASELDRSNLSEANLKYANAAFATATGISLRAANLSSGSWFGADLRNANLESANLRDADLRNVDLRGANLKNADLTGAFLINADLRNAKLSGTILKNTDITYALISTNNLSKNQLAGLCSTKVTIVAMRLNITELVPSNKYDDGYAYDSIFEKFYSVGDSVRSGERMDSDRRQSPYPKCTKRKLDKNFNRPVYEGEPEVLNESYRLFMDHAVLEVNGLRQKFLNRIDEALSRFKITSW